MLQFYCSQSKMLCNNNFLLTKTICIDICEKLANFLLKRLNFFIVASQWHRKNCRVNLPRTPMHPKEKKWSFKFVVESLTLHEHGDWLMKELCIKLMESKPLKSCKNYQRSILMKTFTKNRKKHSWQALINRQQFFEVIYN